MPRKPGFNLIGIPQHVIQRGTNREPCFYAEQDYRRYLDDLKESADKYDCRVHAYVLMTNHVHMLMTPMKDCGVSGMMQGPGRRYVNYFDKTYRRTGTLWERRYKSSLVDSNQYLLTCMRYIELNPVRANMVAHPGEYKWSSYPANAQNAYDAVIEGLPTYLESGAVAESRQAAYRVLFRNHMDNDTLHEIRESLNHELVLGRSYFEITNRKTRPGIPGRPMIGEEEAIYVVY